MSKKDSISAYDLVKRVKNYDSDMDLMHPNRLKMVQITLEFLLLNTQDKLKGLDLGIGTGFFTLEFFKKFPKSKIIGIDGAKAMIDLSKIRLKHLLNKIEFIVGDFRDLKNLISDINDLDVVISSYALHHLNYNEKVDVLKILKNKLKNNGWFINADIIKAKSQLIEERIQKIRVNGIIHRAKGKDPRFINFESTRKFLDDLEMNEKDQPLTLSIDLEILNKVGFKNIDLLWKEYREAVICAQKIGI